MEGGQYIVEGDEEAKSTTLIFSMSEEVGALANALKVFQVSHESMSDLLGQLHLKTSTDALCRTFSCLLYCSEWVDALSSGIGEVSTNRYIPLEMRCNFQEIINEKHYMILR